MEKHNKYFIWASVLFMLPLILNMSNPPRPGLTPEKALNFIVTVLSLVIFYKGYNEWKKATEDRQI